MTDSHFPIITYAKENSPKEWGEKHGESHKKAIVELIKIRKELMLARSPHLVSSIENLAKEQFSITQKHYPLLAFELEGIARGSNSSLSEIVILNNYTDFRDIILPDEGCSTLHYQDPLHSCSGQTWDMHSSAKNYVCLIHIEGNNDSPPMVLFSLVGCTGMMGVNNSELFVGVNNINTKNARAGAIWPCLVRHLLSQKTRKEAVEQLRKAPVTSGHNYILTDPSGGEHWEVGPTFNACSSQVSSPNNELIFHTNHCLTQAAREVEDRQFASSTSQDRYKILEKQKANVSNANDMIRLLKNHDNFPKSICSHYESGAQDPSMTCGGGVYCYHSKTLHTWRGCQKYDSNYKEYNFKLYNNSFEIT